MTVVGETTIMVDGEARSVGWKGAAPKNVNDKVIRSVDKFNDGTPRVTFETFGPHTMEIPYLAGAANEQTIDLAFALTDRHDNGTVNTRFFMPVAQESRTGEPETRLQDAREVTIGELQFHHFVGACRN